ncbi:DUF1444 family protein [Achromobacter aloeverae]|uniref:DUF1444 domain-containing protein n=1 Tax=Achromobacter aloeverae TaxID=1750518 RepID=A0A4Q1HEA5_9BURK|nr:DUF1444 family protein [Achromobacter aloeverae]RXN84648.1 hypothetical protein C7R54_25160 [Achromobacter aloeverae]
MTFFSRIFAARQARPLDVAGFAKAYASAAQARYPGADVKIDEAATAAGVKVHWTMPDGMQVNQFLGNAYAAYQRSPADIDAIIAAHLDAAPTGDEAAPATRRANILPLVKTTMWLATSLKQLDAAGIENKQAFITEPLTDELLVAFVEDKPDAMSYVAPGELEGLELTREALMPLALENLRRQLPALTVEGQDGRYGVRADGNYDASFVFLAQEWRDRVDIDGEPVIALPARDELLVCGSNDADSVRSLRDMAARIMAQSAYGLSAQLFTWKDGQLSVFAD